MRSRVLLATKLQAYWVPCHRPSLTVSSGPSGFTSLPSPMPLRVQVHPLLRFSPLQSPFRSKPARHRSTEQPPLRFRSPSRHQQEESTNLRASQSRYVPSSAFCTPSTACSSSSLAGLFHPATTSGIHFSGVFLATKPLHLVDAPFPLVVLRLSSISKFPH